MLRALVFPFDGRVLRLVATFPAARWGNWVLIITEPSEGLATYNQKRKHSLPASHQSDFAYPFTEEPGDFPQDYG